MSKRTNSRTPANMEGSSRGQQPSQGRTVQFDISEGYDAHSSADNIYTTGFSSNSLSTANPGLPPSFYGSSFPPVFHQLTSNANARRNEQHGRTQAHAALAPGNGASSWRNSPTLHRPNRPNIPQRTTKITQKLVLFPDDSNAGTIAGAAIGDDALTARTPPDVNAWANTDQNITSGAVSDPSQQVSGIMAGVGDAARTHAERQSKEERTGIPRVTCYCVAESFNMDDTIALIRDVHGVIPKQYDECVYFYYEPGMKSRVFGQASSVNAADTNDRRLNQKFTPTLNRHNIRSIDPSPHMMPGIYADFPEHTQTDRHTRFPESNSTESVVVYPWMNRSEVFIFDYGVVALWNFSKAEERQFLSIILKFGVGLLNSDDVEIEDFHFQYDLAGPHQPRIFNDMITLKSSSPLIKLTISHGLAQSVKLSLFENAMEETIDGATPLPRMMAKYGQVKMSRIEIMKIVGQLFRLKMNVNLVSNVLDTPEIFWAEPELEGLYNAIRGYLEISQRAKLLNSRADVLSDLLDMLSEHLNSNEMTFITWVVIVLIFFAVIIAIAEVVVKVYKMQAGIE
ncbi:Sad1-interacting factor 3 [Batrachochytrium dendrobatidis]|nr:Sad1-interacting factor 3 [Batrachochytrium dendrobatidis]KAK5670880.1 Sad1-interacting factor 3 [Batrachochytrium dendrobatidis]